MQLGLLAGVGAAVGSLLRFAVSENLESATYPWATFTVNILGSFLIGLLIGLPLITNNDQRRIFLITGVLGGFTTFSAVVVESLQLEPKLAITYLFSSIFAGLIATTFAFSLSSRIK